MKRARKVGKFSQHQKGWKSSEWAIIFKTKVPKCYSLVDQMYTCYMNLCNCVVSRRSKLLFHSSSQLLLTWNPQYSSQHNNLSTGRTMTTSHLIFHCSDDVIHALCRQHKLNKTIVYIIISIQSNTNRRTETTFIFLTTIPWSSIKLFLK
jgi:hypothetical protein